MKFRTIVADPPWQFDIWSDHGVATSRNGEARKEVRSGSRFPTGRYKPDASARLPASHYTVQDTNWIKSLPVGDLAADNCVLFLWAVWPMMPEALETIKAWGFTYKTLGFDWVKVYRNGSPRMSLGYWTRANTEPCLLATRGKPKRMDKGVSQVIVSGTGEHSEKPEEMYDRIERLVEGPYLELFHRPRNGLFPPRENWRFLGNEVTGNDIRDDLLALAQEVLPLSNP